MLGPVGGQRSRERLYLRRGHDCDGGCSLSPCWWDAGPASRGPQVCQRSLLALHCERAREVEAGEGVVLASLRTANSLAQTHLQCSATLHPSLTVPADTAQVATANAPLWERAMMHPSLMTAAQCKLRSNTTASCIQRACLNIQQDTLTLKCSQQRTLEPVRSRQRSTKNFRCLA